MNPVIRFIKNHLCLIHQNPILKYIHHFHQPLPFPLSLPHLPTIIVSNLQLPQLLQSPLHRHFHLPPLIHHLHHNHSLNLNLLLIFIPCKLVPNLEFSTKSPQCYKTSHSLSSQHWICTYHLFATLQTISLEPSNAGGTECPDCN